MKKTGPTNENLKQLIQELKKESSSQKAGIWKRVANDLSRSTRQRRVVNVAKLNRFVKKDETIIVPGKVLGSGALGHSVTVAAFSFSESAKKIITEAKGKCLTIPELMKTNPTGKNVRIIG
ncbi:50S ribosomal protein L18e [Candidatus Woesearchaeota archaeon]|nr:50S ribosomal protein L18e [Candidatus Woesearchaeota archaeon]MBW2994449.1 50S ribosomal protein L18e [Candidatus Woesearchaeota archaeon]